MKEIRKLIERITPEMLLDMLNFLGFHKNSFNEGNVHFVQYLSVDEVDSVKVPLLRDDVDYEGNIIRLLEYLSARMNTSVESMVLRLLNPAYDVLKWRMSGDEADTGKISLLRMSENIDNIKAVLSASCLDILTPNQRYHKKNKTKNISQNCSWCNYRDICHAELTGGNVEAIFEHDFERKDDGCISKKETT